MNEQTRRLGRRAFLQISAVAGFALPTLVSTRAISAPGRLGANDRVNVGIIGLGGRAQEIARTCARIDGMRIVAICDCFAPRCNQFLDTTVLLASSPHGGSPSVWAGQ
jgi:predicted homoserine dehydrogenase-like protein